MDATILCRRMANPILVRHCYLCRTPFRALLPGHSELVPRTKSFLRRRPRRPQACTEFGILSLSVLRCQTRTTMLLASARCWRHMECGTGLCEPTHDKARNPKPSASCTLRSVSSQDLLAGLLISFSKVHGYTVVTYEAYNTYARRKVSIPHICREFNVEYKDTFAMLRGLNARFIWEQP